MQYSSLGDDFSFSTDISRNVKTIFQEFKSLLLCTIKIRSFMQQCKSFQSIMKIKNHTTVEYTKSTCKELIQVLNVPFQIQGLLNPTCDQKCLFELIITKSEHTGLNAS